MYIITNWRQGAYSIAYIKTGSDAALTVELASPSGGNSAGSQSTMVPVFAGQKLWGARNPDVAYGDVYFIPYKY